MKRLNFVALAVLTVVAFVSSSIWYCPLLFGRQILALSGVTASAQPSPTKAVFELLRTLVLAFIIAGLVRPTQYRRLETCFRIRSLALDRFSRRSPTRVILWQNIPWQLAAIHSGDIKLILIPVGVAAWPKRASSKSC